MREAKIVMALLAQEYLKPDELADIVGVSPRTIRNDLQQLAATENGFLIERSRKLGYHLVITDQELFQEYQKNANDSSIDMQQMRLESLLIVLLVKEEYQTIQAISEIFLVSQSQIKNDLAKLAEYLDGTALKLERKAHYGVRIIGDLRNRLLLLMDRLQRENPKLQELLAEALTDSKRQALQAALFQLVAKRQWDIDYSDFRHLEEEIMLLILIESQGTVAKSEGYLLAELFQAAGLSLQLSEEAYQYFEASILAKTKTLAIRSNREELQLEILNYFKEQDQQQQTHFAEDQEFIHLVYLHVASLIERSRQALPLDNPYVEEISKKYPTIFNYAVLFAKWLEQQYQLTISSGEIGYLATHMTVPFHKRQQELIENIYRIAVVCSSGGGMAYLVEMKLRRIFPQAKIQTFSMFEVQKIQDYFPDLVFSIIELQLELNCLVILINEVQSELDYLEVSENLDLLQQEENFSIEESFFELFSAENFAILPKQPYRKILAELSENLEAAGGDSGYSASLLEREDYLSTVYQNGIAIPHPLTMQGSRNQIFVGVLPEGASEAQNNPQIIFMVSLEEKQLERHRIISKELSKLMSNPAAVAILVKSNNFQEFYYTLKKVLGRRK
ncbi:BglG family transcription antiterminator [Enterococcus sp. HY326]|uniref:BglG family transcription antiterminator n=1 Tax=Enterococcus sp. HY326 TaxID=2971265 RepID=UPI00223F6E25|nr:PTS sugar transporter subunit IIA [Enterococcus sp. HY326]